MTTKALPERLPPFDADAEQAVLGSILIDNAVMDHLTTLVSVADFFREHNGTIYQACQVLYERSEAINQITLAHELTKQGKLDGVGGAVYLNELVGSVPTSLHADYYASIVRNTALKRRLIQTAGKIAQMGYDDTAISKALSDAEEMLFTLREHQIVQDLVPIRVPLEDYLSELATVHSQGEVRQAKVPTGFSDLDKILGGLHASDLIILAARPSMGKSSLLLNITEHAALRHKAHVAFFTLEMSTEQMVQRLVSSNAGVELRKLRLEYLSDSERWRVMESVGVLSEAPIWLDDSSALRVPEIRSKCKRLANQNGLDLVVVDYIGLVGGSGRHENRVQEVGNIAKGFKALAKELNVPVLLAAQLSRAVEQRTPHIPMLSDLRESGEIEAAADVVMFIYREDYYTDEEEWHRKQPTKPYPKGIADIIVAKHRNGPTGQCSLIFHEQLTRFVGLEMRRDEGSQWW